LFGCKSVGIDPASDLISRYMGDCQVFEGQAESLPFKDAEFDIVVSITAVHNFDDIEKGLLEMRRVGKAKFAFSILKKSPKAKRIRHFINDLFSIVEIIEEEKDFIYICTAQNQSDNAKFYKPL
jgi:ubiquinone/menaquinone biosynthesis C-methylase UbiE